MSKYGVFRLSATFGRLTFLIRCDNNPDFKIDRNGIINPNAMRGRGLCIRISSLSLRTRRSLNERSQMQRRFSLDLCDVVLAHQTPR